MTVLIAKYGKSERDFSKVGTSHPIYEKGTFVIFSLPLQTTDKLIKQVSTLLGINR